MRTTAISLLMAVLSLQGIMAQTPAGQTDSVFVEQMLRNGWHEPLAYARQFLGRSYVPHTLECNDDEQLVVNTRGLDCTTLVENVAALTICARRGERSFAQFKAVLQRLRYRGGVIDGYASRLHYFTDWIDDNIKMGLVSEASQSSPLLKGVQRLDINYMSTHPDAYKALAAHPELTKEIAAQERRLTGRSFRFLRKADIADTEAMRQLIHDGDIIAITCSKKGLDIAHLGFAVWHDDGLHLLNASQIHKKVVEEPMTLAQYLGKHPSHTGIRVVRIEK